LIVELSAGAFITPFSLRPRRNRTVPRIMRVNANGYVAKYDSDTTSYAFPVGHVNNDSAMMSIAEIMYPCAKKKMIPNANNAKPVLELLVNYY
jgi:hypothetical protein